MPSGPAPEPPGDRQATAARAALVDQLRRTGVIRTEPVAAAIRAVPRHRFLPAVPLARAYADDAIVTRTGPDGLPTSSASQPAIVAIMLEQLDVRPGHRVLEIGAGTGYNAALLAHLAGPSGRVTTIDVDPRTATEARQHLDAAGVADVQVLAADGWLGHPPGAPYDRTEATVGIWDVSLPWVEQLVEGGALVAPLWLGPGLQVSVAFAKSGNELRSGSVVPCGFMRLRGTGAGRESYRTVGDWRVSAERLEGDAAAILERLLATPATSRPAPESRRGWLVRLALQGDRALILHDEGNRRAAAGLFDPSSESLVLAAGSAGSPVHWAPEAIRSHGSEALLPELMALLADADDLQVEQLQIVAVRRGDPLPEGGGRPTWVLERPQHRFLVRA